MRVIDENTRIDASEYHQREIFWLNIKKIKSKASHLLQ
jgi:hypothetical protein